MGMKRNVDLFTALRYKGQGPMLTFILHRIAGTGLFIFFTAYILALAGVGFVNDIFGNWLFQIIILFCVFFHAINGLRITILDIWPKLQPYQHQAVRIEWAVFWPLYVFAVLVVIRAAFGG
jgi:succinate dehydrogenase / fumarate reductase cytochrome b subunit